MDGYYKVPGYKCGYLPTVLNVQIGTEAHYPVSCELGHIVPENSGEVRKWGSRTKKLGTRV